MEYQLLAVDLDGTLFSREREIARESVDAFKAFSEQGGEVVVCSGRSPLSTRWILKTIGLSDPIIAYNGAVIQEADGKIHEQSPFRKEDLVSFIEACHKFGVYAQLYEGDHLLVPEVNELNKRWIENNIPSLLKSGGTEEECSQFRGQCEVRHVEALADYVDTNEPAIHKLAAFPKEGCRFEEFISHLNTLKEQFEVSSSFSYESLEISPAGISKASALQKLASMLDISMERVAAIGDNFNDVYMLQEAGLGIAMGNAPDEVKKLADAVTETNDNLGVAKAVRKYLLK